MYIDGGCRGIMGIFPGMQKYLLPSKIIIYSMTYPYNDTSRKTGLKFLGPFR
jgi:hypothetical protein